MVMKEQIIENNVRKSNLASNSAFIKIFQWSLWENEPFYQVRQNLKHFLFQHLTEGKYDWYVYSLAQMSNNWHINWS